MARAPHRRQRGETFVDPGTDALRFAFYGRISTTEYQDARSSWRWQRDCAEELIAGRGSIVADFFDAGVSRRRGWNDRPQAAALLAAAAATDRGFDAIVVGEYERAFYGDQITQLVPVLAAHGVQVWLPETHGPVDLQDPAHVALVMLLGGAVAAGSAAVAVPDPGRDAGSGS